jgi:hypothetical protein
MKKQKKLLLAAALGLCTTLPAMAAGGSASTGLLGLPLPPLQLGGTLGLPSLGGSTGSTAQSTTLPGLGIVEVSLNNEGAGKLLVSTLSFTTLSGAGE